MRDNRRTRFILAALLLGGFALITLDAHGARAGGQEPLAKARAFGQAVFGPVERAAGAAVHGVTSRLGDWGGAGADRRRVALLTAQVAQLKAQVEASGEESARAKQLDGLLRLTAGARLATVPALMVGLSPQQDGSWAATIDAGAVDGIKPDETVLNRDGLVGRTVAVGAHTSTVLLAVDPGSTVGVRLAGGGTVGTASGQDAHTLRVAFLDPGLQVKPGTVVLTLGSPGGTPFVSGLPVGVVRKVIATPGALTRTVLVTPYSDVTALDTVGVVVQQPRTDPRSAMAPGVP